MQGEAWSWACVDSALCFSMWTSTGSYWEFYCNYPEFFLMEVGTETNCDGVPLIPKRWQ